MVGLLAMEEAKKGPSKRTRIPKFRSFIRKPKRKGRRKRGRASGDSTTTIGMWTVISFLASVLLHTEIVFVLFYSIFLLYTIISKDMGPIRLVSSIIWGIGILFFIALTLAVVLSLFTLLQEPVTWKAYQYIIGVPLASWGIVRILENWIYND